MLHFAQRLMVTAGGEAPQTVQESAMVYCLRKGSGCIFCERWMGRFWDSRFLLMQKG